MKIVALLLLVLPLHCIFTNTTTFWGKELGISAMHYQAYTGFEEINWFYPAQQSKMFYQLFGAWERDVNASDARVPLIIWLQGGPGSSSQFGAFQEIGPVRINKGTPQNGSSPWSIFGHLLFIDQPLNVGFSFNNADRRSVKNQVTTAHQAASHLVNFLDNFYKQWPALKKSPLFITGQSYAGHYIPAFASALIANKTFMDSNGIVLEGIAIGDGWTDPINQINYYDSFLYSVGIVSNKFRDVCTWFQTHAIVNIYESNYKNATNYFDFLTNNDTTAETYWGGMSIFNFRNYNGLDKSFADYLTKNKASLGIPTDLQFISGNDAVYTAFAGDISMSYATEVQVALKYMRVLLYNGQEDMVVNTAGALQWINSIDWTGIQAWKRSHKTVWRIGGEIKGWTKVYNNLWFALVNRAGHMVPTDQPASGFSLLGHFIHNDRNWDE